MSEEKIKIKKLLKHVRPLDPEDGDMTALCGEPENEHTRGLVLPEDHLTCGKCLDQLLVDVKALARENQSLIEMYGFLSQDHIALHRRHDKNVADYNEAASRLNQIIDLATPPGADECGGCDFCVNREKLAETLRENGSGL